MTTPDINAVVLPPLPKLPWHDDASIAQWAERYATATVLADRERLVKWVPTSEAINALPEPLQLYIAALETNCDPSGVVRELTQAKDVIRELSASNRQLRDAALAAIVADRERRAPAAPVVEWINVADRLPTLKKEFVHHLIVAGEFGGFAMARYDGWAKYFEMDGAGLGGHEPIMWLRIPVRAQGDKS